MCIRDRNSISFDISFLGKVLLIFDAFGGGGFLFEPGLKNGFFGETEQIDFAQLPRKRKVTISFKGTINSISHQCN